MDDKQITAKIEELLAIVRDLPATDAELVMQGAYNYVVHSIHGMVEQKPKNVVMQHVSAAYAVWYDTIRIHYPEFTRKH